VDSGTYHVRYSGGQWVDGCSDGIPGNIIHFNHLPPGVTFNDMVSILSDPWFMPATIGCVTPPVDPCANSIHYITPLIQLPSGYCVILEVRCCDGLIDGNYKVVDCYDPNTILGGGHYRIEYHGIPNPSMGDLKVPGNWQWLGSGTLPMGMDFNDLLDVVSSPLFDPCLQ